MRFIDQCDKYGIILAILPPHSTHRLQPLDVGVFGPLAQAYSSTQDEYIRRHLSWVSMKKRVFWSIFWPSWQKALTLANVKSAFASTGISPYDPTRVVAKITKRPITPPENHEQPKKPTPVTPHAIRTLQREIARNQVHQTEAIQRLTKATEKLAIALEISNHENARLKEALIEYNHRKKRGKPMRLLDPDKPGQAQFFSPTKIRTVREKQQIIEAQETQKQAELADIALQKDIEKQERLREKEEKRDARVRGRIEKANEKALHKQCMDHLRLLRLLGEPPVEKQRIQRPRLDVEQEAQGGGGGDQGGNEQGDGVESEIPVHTAIGRRIRRPARFME
jgi:hypothetical protein